MNGTVPPLDFQFDGAVNMVLQSVSDPNLGKHERYLCWDEENRLSATRDQYYATANIYDASGNRAWRFGYAHGRTNQKYPDRADLAYHKERSVAVSPMAILYLEF